jgi:hypothetical protein
MLVKLVVLAVLMSGSAGAPAQAQKNTDVPSGPAVWPLIKAPGPTQSSPAPKGNNPGGNGEDGKAAPPHSDSTGTVGGDARGNGANTRGK